MICHFGKLCAKKQGEGEPSFSTYAHLYTGRHQLPFEGSRFPLNWLAFFDQY